jgi:hypothetical protein
MHPFEQYVQTHNIDPVQLSIFAKVRYLTVWNAMKGHPIAPDRAQKIRTAVHLLTGIAYTGEFVILPTPSIDQLPTLLFKRVKILK